MVECSAAVQMAGPKLRLLLLTQGTRLEKSLPHISVALRAVPNPPGGLFAQLIEMGVHSWNPSFIRYRQSSGAL